MALQLVIGDRNYSSWSLRAALAVDLAGADCEELRVRLFFGFMLVQTAHRHVITGTPCEVPVPKNVISTF